MSPISPPEWTRDAVCASVDPELWFPEKGSVTDGKKAKMVCGVCPVREECLEYALDNGERYGVWGGATERERRPMARNLCRTCGVRIEGAPHDRYCGDECRKDARRKQSSASEHRYRCIGCGGPTTALRCPGCQQQHLSDMTMTRAQTREAAA